MLLNAAQGYSFYRSQSLRENEQVGERAVKVPLTQIRIKTEAL